MFILRLICLILGTALAVFYLLMQLRGRKYADMVADLEDFENKDLCPAGFAMQDIPALSVTRRTSSTGRPIRSITPGSTTPGPSPSQCCWGRWSSWRRAL